MALEQFDLSGQVAIVTGAGKGVGQGIACVLAEAGATVVGTARTEADIVDTITGIEAAGGQGLALVADAMSRPDGERVVSTVAERFGRTGSQEKMEQTTPLRRLGDVEDLGRLCVYLATRDCYATNAIFHVDGGIDSNNSPLPIPDY